MIATRLGQEFRPYYTMAAFHKRPAREGLLAGHCDIQFGMPYTEGPHYLEGEVELTKPFIELGYALVVARQVKMKSYHDLTGMKIAVLTGSPPQMALSSMDDVSIEYCLFSEVAMEKLKNGEVDAAFIWGPEAGYLNKFRYLNNFKVIPTNYEWPVAIGTAFADSNLRNQINQLIGQMDQQIQALKDKYGFPAGASLEMPGFRYDFKD
jgi:ABC-type amino acid transport substrate-binding protein